MKPRLRESSLVDNAEYHWLQKENYLTLKRKKNTSNQLKIFWYKLASQLLIMILPKFPGAFIEMPPKLQEDFIVGW